MRPHSFPFHSQSKICFYVQFIRVHYRKLAAANDTMTTLFSIFWTFGKEYPLQTYFGVFCIDSEITLGRVDSLQYTNLRNNTYL